MVKGSKKQRIKVLQNKEKKLLRGIQRDNREKFYNGDPVTIKIKKNVPKPYEFNRAYDSNTFEEKEKKIKSLDLQVSSDSDTKAALLDVISVNGVVAMQLSYRSITQNYLYRIRWCDDCVGTIKETDDAWNPPEKYVSKKGRLNNEHESVLYVAENIKTTVKEMKISEDKCFWLIVYVVNNPLTVVNIGESSSKGSPFSKTYNKVAKFLREEFRRDVKPGEEYNYRVSNLIAKFFYPYSNHDFDGWSYPSVADEGENSICLKPIKAKEKLTIACVMHCLIKDGKIQPDNVGFLNENGIFVYEKEDEALKRHKFKEIYSENNLGLF